MICLSVRSCYCCSSFMMNRKALGFDDSESEEDLEEFQAPKRSNQRPNNKDIIAQSLRNQAKTKKYEEENPEIYQYDEVYGDIEAQRELKKPKVQNQGGSKYIGTLLEAKRQRKMDKLYIQDLKVQKERELEGDEYKDKESFVTSGYKEFQQERSRDQSEGSHDTARFRESLVNTQEEKKDDRPESEDVSIDVDENPGSNVKPGLNPGLNVQRTAPKTQQLPASLRSNLPNATMTNVNKLKSKLLPKLSDDEIESYRERYLQRKAKEI